MDTPTRLVGLAVVALLGLVGCRGQGQNGAAALPSLAPTGSVPTTASDEPVLPSPPQASLAPPASESSQPVVQQPAPLPDTDRTPKTSSLRQGFPVLVGVRTGTHPGYTRYVFDFVNDDPEGHSPLGSARPGWDVRYVPPSMAVQDSSGDPPPVGGAVYLRIRFDDAAAHYGDGSPSIRYGLDAHSPLGFGGDFEGRVTWFLGLDHERPFKVSFVANNRVVVDVVDRQ